MATVVAYVLPLTLLWSTAAAATADCGLVNGGFEDDGYVRDIVATGPSGWSVNVPASKFFGYVYRDSPTEGTYNLTLHNQRTLFKAGDMATVAQDLELSGVEQLVFDLRVASDFSLWDPSVCSAVVLIDGDVVWSSDLVAADAGGWYRDQACPLAAKYRTPGPHKVALGLRVNQDAALWERYYTYWDAVECQSVCGGGGLLPGDFNGDCFVNAGDLMLLAAVWLTEAPAGSAFDLAAGHNEDPNDAGGTINCFDLAVLGNNWLGSSLAPEE